MAHTDNFTIGFYFGALTQLLSEPRRFFSELPQEVKLKQSLGFLVVSGLFFAGASLAGTMYPNPLLMGGIFFINAVGMAFITAGFGYMVMTMSIKDRVSFSRLFSIYAFSSGVTLLASWVPFFLVLTEPWKWWLIGTGMVKHCGFRVKQALLVIGVSVAVLVLFFWSLLPVVVHFLRPVLNQ